MKFLFPKFLLLTLAIFASGIQAAEPTPAELQNQLRFAREQLLELRKKYTDTHPTVVEQKAKIAALEKQVGPAAEPLNPAERVPRQFSIDFPGGTVRDFLTAVSKIEGVSVNIIAQHEGSDLLTPLPAFSLRNTSAQVVIQVLTQMVSVRGFALIPVGMEPNSVTAVLTRQSPGPRPTPTQFESYPVGPYLIDQTIDDIVGAIRAGWELDPAHDKEALRLKFHPGTSILLVSGPPDAIQVAAKVISQLKGAYDKDSKSNLRKLSPNPEPTKR